MANSSELYRYSCSATPLASSEQVAEADLASFRETGFLAVEQILSPAEIAVGKEALRDLINGRVPNYAGVSPEPGQAARWNELDPAARADLVRRVFLFVDFEPRLKALSEHPAVLDIVEQILGEPCHLIQDMALLKPPFVGTEKPWHQDMAYFQWGPPEKVIGVWIALDPATAENGCMHVLPGTHNEGAKPHTHDRDCQLPDDSVDVERDVMVPLAPGGALFFSSLLHHGTPPNSSPHGRWALQFHYAANSARPIDASEHTRLFHDQDGYGGCWSASLIKARSVQEA